jgi:hypothetical protein
MLISVASTSIMGEADHLKDYNENAMNPKKNHTQKYQDYRFEMLQD